MRILLLFLSLRRSKTTEAISPKTNNDKRFLALALVARTSTLYAVRYTLVYCFNPAKIVPKNKSLPASDTQKPPTENLPDSSTID